MRARVVRALPGERRRSDAVALGGAVVVAALGLWVCARHGLSSAETGVFRGINDLGGSLSGTAQAVNRLGTITCALVVVVVCVLLRSWRAALDVAATALLVRLVSRQAKTWTGRGRLGDLLPDVAFHGPIPGGFGYPSGHTAMAAAIATALVPHLPARWRWAPVLAVALVAVGRIYVGAHLPLDVVGGAAVGLAVGSAVHLVLGVPAAGARRGWRRR